MTEENNLVEPIRSGINHSSRKKSKKSDGMTELNFSGNTAAGVSDFDEKTILDDSQIFVALLAKAKKNGGKIYQSDLDEATQRPDLTLEKSVAAYETLYGHLLENGIQIVDDTDDLEKNSDLSVKSDESVGGSEQEKPPELDI